MRRLMLKFCQRKTDDERDMSRSLSRIRNLISEIEEIQRQGQQGNKTLKDRVPAPSPEVYSASAPLKPVAPEFVMPSTHAAKIDQ